MNIHDHNSNSDRCLSVLQDIEEWRPIEEPQETLTTLMNDNYNAAKEAELLKWKQMNVYTVVNNTGQKTITTRWVCSERLKAGKLELKARLCARGCEDVEDVPMDSPTCERDNVRLMLSIVVSHWWPLH